jgi:hypothetical protein
MPLPVLVETDPPLVLVASPLDELEAEFSRPPCDVPQATVAEIASALR